MDDSSEGYSEENRVSPGKNNKRMLKTPAQVLALENFYNDYKYPSEELKSELAEQIGLTEKQISSWFCHRRLKDKKRDEVHASRRHDRSSSIIQDRGSGLRQDSCGSTKQGDFRTGDPREVESERLYNRHFPATDLSYDHASRYTGNVSSMGDLSPQSSSSLREKSISPHEDPYDMECSRYLTQNGATMPPVPKSANGMLYKPSGYLKVRGEIENAAITAVKRQLGRQYREDGPLLGVEFDPLPPGAFASPSRDIAPGPFYVGDLIRARSPDVCGVRNQSNLNTRYEVYSSKMGSQDSHLEGANSNAKYGTETRDMKSHNHLERHSAYDDHVSYQPSKKSTMDQHDDLAGGISVYHGKRKSQMSSKHDVKGIRSDSLSRRRGPDGQKLKSEQREPWLSGYDNDSPQTHESSDYMYKPSNLILESTKAVRSKEKTPYTKMAKEEKQMKGTKPYRDPARVAKPSRVDVPQEEYVAKDSFPCIPPRPNAKKGSLMEKPSSFSEDETAETSSSGDSGADN